MTDATISKAIKAISDTMAKKFSASKVYVFGSHAYGQPDVGSDIDICVLMSLGKKRKLDWMREIRKELSLVLTQPFDLLVYEPAEFHERASLKSTLEHKILTQGLTIYEQQGNSTRMVHSR